MTLPNTFRNQPAAWALLIILLTTCIRLVFVATGQLTLVQDEAQYWDWTRHPQLSYYSKGPLISWVIALWTSVFSDTELGVRFGSVFHSFLTQLTLFFGVSLVFRRPMIALWTLFVFNTMLIFCGLSILMTTDSPLILCYALFLFSLYAALHPRDKKQQPLLPYFFMALSLALGVLAKYMMLIALPQALLFAFLNRRTIMPGTWSKLIVTLLIGSVLGLLPILLWNIAHDFVGFKHVAHLSGAAGQAAQTFIRFDRFPDFIGSQFVLATPWWLLLLLGEVWRRLRTKTIPALHRDDLSPSHVRLLIVFFLPLFAFVFFWSFHTKIMPNWIAVTYIPGCMLAAAAMHRLWTGSGIWAKRLRLTIPIFAIGLFVLGHTFHLLPIPNEVDPTRRVKGWRELGMVVSGFQAKFEDPSKVFIFSDQYDMTAALAFYVPGQPRTYCAWLDRRMSQYDLWPGPDHDKVGWDAILVFKDKTDSSPSFEIQKMFGSLEGPIYLTTRHQGKEARMFTLFLCREYNGYWPRQNSGQF